MFTFDLATNVGKIRLLIPDRVVTDYVFEDADLTALFTLEDSNIKRATALALETIAADQAMTLKVIRVLDLTTDGAKVSDALLKRAEGLRTQATYEDSGLAGGAFDVAEIIVTDFNYREKIWNESLR